MLLLSPCTVTACGRMGPLIYVTATGGTNDYKAFRGARSFPIVVPGNIILRPGQGVAKPDRRTEQIDRSETFTVSEKRKGRRGLDWDGYIPKRELEPHGFGRSGSERRRVAQRIALRYNQLKGSCMTHGGNLNHGRGSCIVGCESFHFFFFLSLDVLDLLPTESCLALGSQTLLRVAADAVFYKANGHSGKHNATEHRLHSHDSDEFTTTTTTTTTPQDTANVSTAFPGVLRGSM
jgi:hypothetical protein